jgi:hypothetical protein
MHNSPDACFHRQLTTDNWQLFTVASPRLGNES